MILVEIYLETHGARDPAKALAITQELRKRYPTASCSRKRHRGAYIGKRYQEP